jgi:hypothetical protein
VEARKQKEEKRGKSMKPEEPIIAIVQIFLQEKAVEATKQKKNPSLQSYEQSNGGIDIAGNISDSTDAKRTAIENHLNRFISLLCLPLPLESGSGFFLVLLGGLCCFFL